MTDNPCPIIYSINSEQETPTIEKQNDIPIFNVQNLNSSETITFKSIDLCFIYCFLIVILAFFIAGLVLTIIGAIDKTPNDLLYLIFGGLFILHSIILSFSFPFGSIMIIDAQNDVIKIANRSLCVCCCLNDNDHAININNFKEVKFKKRIIFKEINGEYVQHKVTFTIDFDFKVVNSDTTHHNYQDEDKNGRYELIYNTLRNIIPENVPFIEESERVI